jgi:hypothetical protein
VRWGCKGKVVDIKGGDDWRARNKIGACCTGKETQTTRTQTFIHSFTHQITAVPKDDDEKNAVTTMANQRKEGKANAYQSAKQASKQASKEQGIDAGSCFLFFHCGVFSHARRVSVGVAWWRLGLPHTTT